MGSISGSTEAETAWAAGLFEGEGCIFVNKARAGGVLIVRMTDEDVLNRFATIVGCGHVRGPIAPVKQSHKPAFEWRCGTWSDVLRILTAFSPWLGARRRHKAADLLNQPVKMRRKSTDAKCRSGHALTGPDARVRVTGKNGNSRVCVPCELDRQRERRMVGAA